MPKFMSNIWRYFPTYLWITKEKIVTLQWRNLNDNTLTTWSRFTSSLIRHIYISPVMMNLQGHFCDIVTIKCINSIYSRENRNKTKIEGYSNTQLKDVVYKWQYPSKVLRSWKTRKDWINSFRLKQIWRHKI